MWAWSVSLAFKMIVMLRVNAMEGKARTDMFHPAGFMDVRLIESTKNEVSADEA